MASEKGTFSKIGVIAATVGSAIGLGTVWRFPGETQANGGAAFLFVYILCMLFLGIPVMLAELSLGRAGGSDAVGNFKNLTPKNHWWLAGTIGLLASYLILAFYMVVAGWTIEYLFNSLSGDLFSGYVPSGRDAGNAFFADKMSGYIMTSWSPVLWTYVMIFINLAVLILGVSKGIEKMSNLLMPMLFVIMLIFCYTSLSLPHASEGIEFFFHPDFSKINVNVVLNALGQAFFSLSLGMGILVTYAAYYPKDTNLTRTSFTVSGLVFLMSVLMGLIIFPAVKSFGLDSDAHSFEGTALVFVTLPEIFASMKGTYIWSVLFFLLLAVAALTSTVSIAEVSVAFVRDRFKMSRTWACLIVLLPIFVLSTLCSMSLGAMPSLRLFGMSIFDLFDNFTTNYLLPMSAFAVCIYVGWVLPRDFIKNELTNYGTIPCRLSGIISFLIRFIAPVLILLIFLAKFFSE